LRKYLQFSQEDFAKELGTRQQTISEWELGLYNPRGMSKKLLTQIAEKADFTYNTE
jgi:DNA-binding transcriptional regulator YiaG